MEYHTAGPWVIYQDRDENGEPDTLHVGTRAERLGQTPQYVADICTWGGPCKESNANARLIAAAPALMEALRMALDESGCDGDLCAHRWHDVARAALRAAGVE